MRDPERIDKFCEELAQAWHKVPDMRFGQFIMNILGTIELDEKRDAFYIEDAAMLDKIKNIVDSWRG